MVWTCSLVIASRRMAILIRFWLTYSVTMPPVSFLNAYTPLTKIPAYSEIPL